MYSKTCVKQPLSKRPKIGFQDQLSLNAGQKYCRMLQGEHSAILSTFIKLPFVLKIFVLSIFKWPFYTGFTACPIDLGSRESDVSPGKTMSKKGHNSVKILYMISTVEFDLYFTML